MYALSILGVTALAGCSANSTPTASPEVTPTAASPTSATPTSPSAGGGSDQSTETAAGSDQSTETAVPELNLVTVTAHDEGDKGGMTMSYDVAGSPHAGLVDIRFVNAGNDTHELSFMRLKPDVSLDQMVTALQEDEAAAMDFMIDPDTQLPGPAMIGPGASVDVQTDLVPGHYLAICFLPGHDQQPHFAMGMINEFTVGDPAGASTAPATDGTITLSDDGISLPDGLAAHGGGTFEVTNTGTTSHDLSLALLDQATLPELFQCVGSAFEEGKPVDSCPGTLMGGVSFLAPGQSAYLTVELPPGEYGYVSTADNDFQSGLNGVFTVG